MDVIMHVPACPLARTPLYQLTVLHSLMLRWLQRFAGYTEQTADMKNCLSSKCETASQQLWGSEGCHYHVHISSDSSDDTSGHLCCHYPNHCDPALLKGSSKAQSWTHSHRWLSVSGCCFTPTYEWKQLQNNTFFTSLKSALVFAAVSFWFIANVPLSMSAQIFHLLVSCTGIVQEYCNGCWKGSESWKFQWNNRNEERTSSI